MRRRKMKKSALLIFGIVLVLVLSACNLTKNYVNPSDPSTVSTLAMQTVQAMATQQAFATLAGNATDVSNLPTANVVDQSTQSSQNPTEVMNTPSPTVFYTPMPTFTPIPKDQAGFVKDVTIPDDTVMAADTNFTKTWRLKNIGQTTWTSDYEVVFSSGNAMGSSAAKKLAATVKPGETIDISLDLKSPSTSGKYTGEWMLRTPAGKLFGLGENADKPFWVKIEVENYASEPVPSEIYDLDFTAEICSADWKSNYETVRTPCDTDKSMTKAFVAVLSKPKLENGYVDDERTIHMHLDGDNGNWIQGFYPAMQIEDDASFHTIVGCLDGNKSCNVSVSIDIRVDGGSTQNIGKWTETYDGEISRINIDLSSYAGKNVQFILGISNRSDTISEVFWLAPRVDQ